MVSLVVVGGKTDGGVLLGFNNTAAHHPHRLVGMLEAIKFELLSTQSQMYIESGGGGDDDNNKGA